MKLPAGIKKLTRVSDLGTTPAKCRRNTGEVFINARVWDKLHPDHRYFILCHEAGHIMLNTENEVEADAYAFKEYAKSGRSLTNSVKALSRVLTFNNPEHHLRLSEQLGRALKFDFEVNGNENANPEFMQTTSYTPEEFESAFLGKLARGLFTTKEGRANRQQKREDRSEKRDAKTELIYSKASKKEDTGEAKVLNAQANLLNAGAPPATEEKTILGMPQKTFAIAVIVVVVILGIVWYYKKKKA